MFCCPCDRCRVPSVLYTGYARRNARIERVVECAVRVRSVHQQTDIKGQRKKYFYHHALRGRGAGGGGGERLSAEQNKEARYSHNTRPCCAHCTMLLCTPVPAIQQQLRIFLPLCICQGDDLLTVITADQVEVIRDREHDQAHDDLRDEHCESPPDLPSSACAASLTCKNNSMPALACVRVCLSSQGPGSRGRKI